MLQNAKLPKINNVPTMELQRKKKNLLFLFLKSSNI